jgi:hypothetical protein
MSDAFVPLAVATNPAAAAANGFTPLSLKSFPAANAKAVPAANGQSSSLHPAAAGCPPPKVTLQRQGDVVTSVRIQCGCGQVIDLNCVY